MAELRDVQTWTAHRVFTCGLVEDETAFAMALRMAPDDLRVRARREGVTLLDVPVPTVTELVESGDPEMGTLRRGSWEAAMYGVNDEVCAYLYEWRCPAVADV